MIKLSSDKDIDKIYSITKDYPEYFTVDLEEWCSHNDNHILMSDRDVAFAEGKGNGVYWVHFCFNSRGKEAIELTKTITKVFISNHNVKTLVGLIEVVNKPAKYVIRQAGFKSLGELMTKNGLCELFHLNVKDI